MKDVKELVREFFDGLVEIRETRLPVRKGPHDDRPGVFIIFSQDKSVASVGRSKVTMGREIWRHAVNAYKPGQEVKWAKNKAKKPYPFSVTTIAFDEKYKCLIEPLKSFLIKQLPQDGIELL